MGKDATEAGGTRHSWTDAQEDYLLEEYRHIVVDGKGSDSNAKTTHWKLILTRFNSKFRCTVTIGTLQNKFQAMKTRFSLAISLSKKSSGWGWDPVLFAPTAAIGVLQEHYKWLEETGKKNLVSKHRDVIQRGVRNFDLLNELFGSTVASGALSKSSTQPRASDLDETRDSHSKNNDDASTGVHERDLEDLDGSMWESETENKPSRKIARLSAPEDSLSTTTTAQATLTALVSPATSSKSQTLTNTASSPLLRVPPPPATLGKRPQRSHGDKRSTQDQVSEWSSVLTQAISQFSAPDNDSATTNMSPLTPTLPSTVQLPVAVAKKLSAVLKDFNGWYNGENREYLLPKYAFQYGKLLAADSDLAGLFLGFEERDELDGMLENLYESFKK
ncbi:hypothetical protein HDU99_009211 [Rhizoclosmatium hyalinum]|nr:hypothetical protein HDU99_009211 [Rhizoclosmatium hyalinum]